MVDQPFASRKRAAALHCGNIIDGKSGLFRELLLRKPDPLAAFFDSLSDSFIYHNITRFLSVTNSLIHSING